MTECNFEELDPGIRSAVSFLRAHGFDTVDSGDGSKAGAMECAWEVPMVVIQITPERLAEEADRLRGVLSQFGLEPLPMTEDMHQLCIQSSYDPCDGSSTVMVVGDALTRLGGGAQ